MPLLSDLGGRRLVGYGMPGGVTTVGEIVLKGDVPSRRKLPSPEAPCALSIPYAQVTVPAGGLPARAVPRARCADATDAHWGFGTGN